MAKTKYQIIDRPFRARYIDKARCPLIFRTKIFAIVPRECVYMTKGLSGVTLGAHLAYMPLTLRSTLRNPFSQIWSLIESGARDVLDQRI